MKAKRIGMTLAAVMLCLACACSDGGTDSKDGSQVTESSAAQQSGSEETAESSSAGESQESTQQESSQQESTRQTAEPSEQPPAEPEITEVIYNNGGYFVGVEDKVYYREYGPYSVGGIALYGDFLGHENYGGASIKCLENGKAEPAVIVTDDEGFGKLYYCEGWLYSHKMENYEDEVVYGINLETKEMKTFCLGSILGGSADGRYLAVSDYADGKGRLRILKNGVPGGGEYVPGDGYFSYVGSSEDKVFLVLNKDDGKYLMQYDYDGNLVNLAKLPEDEAGYAWPDARNFMRKGNEISFTWEFFEGTGHFLSGAYQVKLPICMDPKGKNAAEPIYEASLVELDVWDDAQQGIYSSEYDEAQLLDPELEKKKAELTSWLNGVSGLASIPQTVEKVNGDIYCIVASAHRNSLDDIGWRESYNDLGYKYLRYAKGSDVPEVLAEVSGDEGPVTVYMWLIGKPGSEKHKVAYRLAYFMGPELPPELDDQLFGAELAEDMVYEFPKDDDIYGEWTRGTREDFYKSVRDFKRCYLSEEPKVGDYQGYEIPKSLSLDYARAVHVGFDEAGRIIYVRPVVMD